MKTFIKIFVLAIFVMFFWQVNFVSANTTPVNFLSVDFQGDDPNGTLFGETRFLPGDTVTRWAKVTNLTDHSIAVKIAIDNFSQTGGMAEKIDFVIKKHGNASPVYSGTLKKLSDDGIVVIDQALSAGATQQYYFSATFRLESEKELMGKSVNFDLNIGSNGEINGQEKKFINAMIINGNVLLPTPTSTFSTASLKPSPTPKIFPETTKFPFSVAQKEQETQLYGSILANDNNSEQDKSRQESKKFFANIYDAIKDFLGIKGGLSLFLSITLLIFFLKRKKID